MGCGSSSSYVIHVEPPRDDVDNDFVVEAPAAVEAAAAADDQAGKAAKTSYGWLLDTWILRRISEG